MYHVRLSDVWNSAFRRTQQGHVDGLQGNIGISIDNDIFGSYPMRLKRRYVEST